MYELHFIQRSDLDREYLPKVPKNQQEQYMCYFVIGVLQPIQIAKETTVGVCLYITVTSEYLQRYPEVQQTCFMKDLVCNLVQILNCNMKKLIVHAAAAAGDHVSRPGE